MKKLFTFLVALAASVGMSWGATTDAKLPGKFSVSAEQVVYFSRGNLQYTRESTEVDWSTGTFRLATNQYDMIETIANPYCTDNCGDKTEIGLFGWGTWGEGKTPNLTTEDQTAYTWSTDFTGTLEGYNDWRTLSKDEWVYLLNTRATGVTVNSTADARYTMATINTDGTPVAGLIIFPDAFAGTATDGVTWGTINDKSDFATTCTAAGWTALEQAGCVFLPACGQRSKINSTANVRTGGCGTDVLYYTSTVYTGFSNGAHNIYFSKSDALADDGSFVRQAFGVRLVSNNAAPSGSCGENLTWEFDPATGALTISGTGAMTSAPWSDYKTQITSVSLPDGLTTIGTGAFQYCSALTSVEIPASVTSINMSAFQYCSALTSVELPNGLTTIGRSAFINCSALTSIEIPASVTSIGIDAFNRCISLTSVVIPNGVTFLGKMAFAYCSQLTSVEIPASVTTINERMFDSCTGLTTITNHATTPQTLGENVFRVLTLSNITLNVPYSALADYQAADVWKDFGTISAIPGTEPAAPATPKAYSSGTVALKDLNVGDILMEGVTLTSEKADYEINLAANRVKCFSSIQSTDWNVLFSSINPVLGENAVILTSYPTLFYTPIDETGNIGNAWEVTENEVGTEVTIAGITYGSSVPEEPATPAAEEITAKVDPDNAGVYYATFFDSENKYVLPAGVEAYVADLSGSNLVLTKIAAGGQTIPADNAVILKSTMANVTLTPSDAEAVTFTANNSLKGVDDETALDDLSLTRATCYVLSGTNEYGVGFYQINSDNLMAHKAYVPYSSPNPAPRRMPFIFDQATGMDNVQGDNVQSTKVVRDGQLVIIRNGVEYNAAGQIVK